MNHRPLTLLLVCGLHSVAGCGGDATEGNQRPEVEKPAAAQSSDLQGAPFEENRKIVPEAPERASVDRLLAPLSKDASKELTKLARRLTEADVAEVHQQFDALPERDRHSADGAVLLASIMIAENKFDEAAERLGTLDAAEKATVPQLLAMGLFLTQREAYLDVAESFMRRAGEVSPEDPLVDYRLCQCLMAQGKYDEGFSAAGDAKSKFATWQKAGRSPPPWMLMESIGVGNLRIDVHYNLGPQEMSRPDVGATRPMSFRIWRTDSAEPAGALLDVFDYEQGWIGGEVGTCAFGKTTESRHVTYETLPVEATYSEIRQRAKDFVKGRYVSQDNNNE